VGKHAGRLSAHPSTGAFPVRRKTSWCYGPVVDNIRCTQISAFVIFCILCSKVEHACGGTGAIREWFAAIIGGGCLMELAALDDVYGDTTAAARHLQAAGAAMGLQLELTGVMGKRTVHQVTGAVSAKASVRTRVSWRGA
jgi:hypothetical protein